MATPDDHKNALDMAWAAGLFEGEGCITAGLQKGRWGLARLAMGSCDRDIMERFVAVVGIGNITVQVQDNPKWKDFYFWQVQGRQIRPILEAFLPHFGERRGAKALEALEVLERIGVRNEDKTHCPQGHAYDEENTQRDAGGRKCRACNRRRLKERGMRGNAR